VAFGYGWFAYLLALSTIAYAIGFLANVGVPRSIDGRATASLETALVVNLGLIGLFGVQHSLMARSWFKSWWTRVVPRPIERSTYVLLASVTLLVVMWNWRSLPGTVWRVDGLVAIVVWVIYGAGWLLVFAAVSMIDRDDLMGLRHVSAYLEGRRADPLGFQTPALYRVIRHPIMTGFLLAFWVTPHMTVGHFAFAAGMTLYVLVGVRLEERDLVAAFGDRYRRYSEDVPRFFPRPGRTVSPESRTDDVDPP
jgi:protein-S-isoprenylcysteine O-methyltransferase Ste14